MIRQILSLFVRLTDFTALIDQKVFSKSGLVKHFRYIHYYKIFLTVTFSVIKYELQNFLIDTW